MAEKPYPMIRRKGFEYYTNGAVEGSEVFGEFEIWKDDDKVHEGRVNESSGRMDRAIARFPSTVNRPLNNPATNEESVAPSRDPL